MGRLVSLIHGAIARCTTSRLCFCHLLRRNNGYQFSTTFDSEAHRLISLLLFVSCLQDWDYLQPRGKWVQHLVISCPFILRYTVRRQPVSIAYLFMLSVCVSVFVLPMCSPDVRDLCLLQQSKIWRQITVWGYLIHNFKRSCIHKSNLD